MTRSIAPDDQIVITGLGAVSALGHIVDELTIALSANLVGRRPVPSYRFSTDLHRYRATEAASIADDVWALLGRLDDTLLSDLALVAAEEAIHDAQLGPLAVESSALVLGMSGLGSGVVASACGGHAHPRRSPGRWPRLSGSVVQCRPSQRRVRPALTPSPGRPG
jgi:3-oxoacyl-(acyl-carrier-protein) synthase